MKNILIMGILFLSFLELSLAQSNIVSNPGFEDGDVPTNRDQLHTKCDDWFSPNDGTPDIFDINSLNTDIQIPTNELGYQNLLTDGGDRYAGIFNIFNVSPNAQPSPHVSVQSEFIGQAINIEKDKIYKISYYISLAENHDTPLTNLGIFFSNEQSSINYTYPDGITPYLKELRDNNGELVYPQWLQNTTVSTTIDWELVSDYYIADDDYNYMYFGHYGHLVDSLNYYSNLVTELGSNFDPNNDKQYGSYYYIDNFEIIDQGYV